MDLPGESPPAAPGGAPDATASSYRMVSSADALAPLCTRWGTQPALGIDTEFERSRTFYPRPALLQVSDGQSSFLIDPLAIRDLDPFTRLLGEENVVKVLHGPGEDLEVFRRMAAPPPRALFDTQLAAAFAGHGYGLGYRRLVRTLAGVELPKDETRSDWLSRPLTESQLAYAALDVAYLIPMYTQLAATLEDRGRGAWLAEDTGRMLSAARSEPDPERAYLRIGQAHVLDQRALCVLQALCAWREHTARARDLPRGFVLRDAVLVDLARNRPQDLAALERIPDLHRREIARSGKAIVDAIREAFALPQEQWPPPLPNPVDLRDHAAIIRTLRRAVRERAAEMGLPPELLARRRAIEALVRRVRVDGVRELPPELEGWRREVVGDRLMELLDTEA